MSPPPPSAACKVCGGRTSTFCEVDFTRTCMDPVAVVFPPSGVAVRYLRCEACGLIFTPDFDRWSPQDFAERIYNADYVRADPDYTTTRPTNLSKLARNAVPLDGLRVLDYGGGNGALAADLRRHGFDATTFDPFNPEFVTRPQGRFDLVTSFETLEHLPDPLTTVRDIADLTDGMVLFSTMLQPANIAEIGPSWWYIGPRNGHVTLYSGQALAALWRSVGMTCVSFNANYHAAFANPPNFARQLLSRGKVTA